MNLIQTIIPAYCNHTFARQDMPNDIKLDLHIIGAGVPVPTMKRFGSAFVLDIDDKRVMVDCGPSATMKMARIGIDPDSVHQLLFTHHHFDHNVDFPCFVLTRWDKLPSEEPLKVYGPPPTASFVDKLMGKDGAFFDDWHARVMTPVSQMLHKQRGCQVPRPGPQFDIREVGPEDTIEADNWKVTIARVHHVEPWLESLAYRFQTPNGSVVFAADCGDCPAIRQLTEGADTLVIAGAVHGDHPEYEGIITGSLEASQIARDCNIKRLVLTHAAPNFDNRPGEIEIAVREAAEYFDGIVHFPQELDTINLLH